MSSSADEPSGSEGPIHRRVNAGGGGSRLDVYLGNQPEVGARGLAKVLIQSGQVFLNDRKGKPGQVVGVGDLVRFDPCPPPSASRPVEDQIADPRVIHEDDVVLVIDKPTGLVCHPAQSGRPDRRSSVAQWAASVCPNLPVLAGEDRPGIVHRLDKETSGVMVLAKTEDAFEFLKAEFQARRVEKEYRALCFGEARFDSDFIHRSIATHPKKGDRMVVVQEGGREASTFYEVVERFKGFTHFKCAPKTGRTHQIRVHMTSVGHGLIGDRFYRSRNHSSSSLPVAAPNPGRHCLHARALGFIHPQTRERVQFEAPIADDMETLLAWFRSQTSP